MRFSILTTAVLFSCVSAKTLFAPIQLLCLINKERQAAQLPPLGISSSATAAAAGHACDLAKLGKVQDAGSDQSTLDTRLRSTGFEPTYAVQSNVAFDSDAASSAIGPWLADAQARKNMLCREAAVFGAGLKHDKATGKYYYSLVFASKGKPAKKVPKCDGTDIMPWYQGPGIAYVQGPGAKASGDAGKGGGTYDAVKMVCLVNAERKKEGLEPLGLNDKLAQAAQAHSDDQAKHGKMTHDGSDQSTVADRVKRVGYTFATVAENVAAGFPSEDAVMVGWMNSPGHRANILNTAIKAMGSARAAAPSGTPYYTQVFGAEMAGPGDVKPVDCTKYGGEGAATPAAGTGGRRQAPTVYQQAPSAPTPAPATYAPATSAPTASQGAPAAAPVPPGFKLVDEKKEMKGFMETTTRTYQNDKGGKMTSVTVSNKNPNCPLNKKKPPGTPVPVPAAPAPVPAPVVAPATAQNAPAAAGGAPVPPGFKLVDEKKEKQGLSEKTTRTYQNDKGGKMTSVTVSTKNPNCPLNKKKPLAAPAA